MTFDRIDSLLRKKKKEKEKGRHVIRTQFFIGTVDLRTLVQLTLFV